MITIASLLLVLIGGIIIIGNWFIVIMALCDGKGRSWIPLIGGTATSVGFYLSPLQFLNDFWWLGFIVDFGSFIGLGYTAIYLLCVHRYSKQN